ncbi:unnamed protein product [Dibothriocephalus latus]|uniref:Peroxin-7 n=1 Tax=Dibothriocephalus latus TaxID=60516 RepID=A0A3P7QC53_DIBLA|nr:unnamed protein product [Dibothriocephalus latus]
MHDFWRCECNLSTYANFIARLREEAVEQLDVNYSIQFDPSQRTSSIDITLDDCVDLVETAEPISWAALSPAAVEHNLIAVALMQSCDRQAILVDPVIGAPALSLRGGHTDSRLSQIVWSARSSFIVITAGHDGRVLFWDIRLPSKPIDSLDNTSAPGYSSYSHDGESFCI